MYLGSMLKEQCHGDSVLFQKPKNVFGLPLNSGLDL